MPTTTARNKPKPDESSLIQSSRMKARNEKTVRLEIVANGFIVTYMGTMETRVYSSEDELLDAVRNFVRNVKT